MAIAIREHKSCYQSRIQRNVLCQISEINLIEQNFFLTGGTALAVFFLGHRTSEDLDLFTTEPVDLTELDQSLMKLFKNKSTLIKSSPQFRSYLVNGIKIDCVIDELSIKGVRPSYQLEKQRLFIDTIDNIASNKLTAAVSRFEMKDLIDLHFIKHYLWKNDEELFTRHYRLAQKKEALLDDPAQAAFQIEHNMRVNEPRFDFFRSILKKRASLARMKKSIQEIVSSIYSLQKW